MRFLLVPLLVLAAAASAQVRDLMAEVPQLALDILEETEAITGRCWSVLLETMAAEVGEDLEVVVSLICGRIESSAEDAAATISELVARRSNAKILTPFSAEEYHLTLEFGDDSQGKMIIIIVGELVGDLGLLVLAWYFE
ncbi:MAG: hypothetical protein OXH85_05060 [Truepera sp.]|nr:hypothetical protein [Truepera sp.]